MSNQSPNPFTFTYDRLGNRLSATEHGSQTAYLPNRLNQYTQVGPITPTYDMNSNLTYDGSQIYAYDSENRLISVQGSSLNQYRYDYAGRRIQKDINGTSNYFLYDGDRIIAEYDSFGTLTAKYVYGVGIDEPLVMMKGGQRYFYLSDGLGSVTAITNSTGATVETYDYDPFGAPIIKDTSGTVIPESTIGNRFMFTGREYDPESGLYHYRARAYSPSLGRFLQTDPVGYFDSQNLYEYVYNNPVNWVDPYGLFGKWLAQQHDRLRDWFNDLYGRYQDYQQQTERDLDNWLHPPPDPNKWPDVSDFWEKFFNNPATNWMDAWPPGYEVPSPPQLRIPFEIYKKSRSIYNFINRNRRGK